MKKRHQQKQPENRSSTADEYLALVPVKIVILHGEAVMKEYEDVINVEFNDHTVVGRQNIRRCIMLQAKGYSTDEALFTLASDAVASLAKEITSQVTLPTAHELHLHVKRNGEINYGKYTS